MNSQVRIGFGFDVHEFVNDRKFFLGGIEIPYSRGLLGHSDADVLLHAICDAILGALALGDIGMHFPNDDPRYHNIDSKKLLKHVSDLITSNGYVIGNVDSTILLQEPKLSPYINQMRQTIAEMISVSVSQVSIKATTTEGLGFVGREEGCSAYAVVLLNKKEG